LKYKPKLMGLYLATFGREKWKKVDVTETFFGQPLLWLCKPVCLSLSACYTLAVHLWARLGPTQVEPLKSLLPCQQILNYASHDWE
jgi:hypothetical protein